MIAQEQIFAELEAAGLSGRDAVVHSSLKSFGYVLGGAEAVASALTRCFSTTVVPTFLWGEGSPELRRPPGEAVARNGLDEDDGPDPTLAAVPFDPERSVMARDMGAIARAVRALPGALRGSHPLASWAAVGQNARDLVAAQPFDDPFYPLRRLMESNGVVVMFGVGLTRCTAIHLAEELAGRKPFVRWVLLSDGDVARVRVGGCSNGFERLRPKLEPVLREARIGSCQITIASVAELVEWASRAIRAEPELTVCARSGCARCRDALAGGPKD